jgi:hypothetical protein
VADHFTPPPVDEDPLPEANPPGYWLDQYDELLRREGYEEAMRDVQEALDARRGAPATPGPPGRS